MSDATTETTSATTEAAPAADSTLLAGETAATETSAVEAKTEVAPADTPADDVKAGDKLAEDDKPSILGAPEEYEFKAPEGVELDTEILDEFKNVAREMDLSQDAAQKVADLGFKLQERWTAEIGEQILLTRQQWLEATQADKEIGGDKLPETLATAKRALEVFGDSELTEVLNSTGLGNHPAVIRAFAKAGKTVSEDGFVGGRNTTREAEGLTPTERLANRLYGGSKE